MMSKTENVGGGVCVCLCEFVHIEETLRARDEFRFAIVL